MSATAPPISSCCSRRLRGGAACRCHRSPRCRRLRGNPQGPVGQAFSTCQQDRSGSGQSQYPCRGIAIRGLRPGRGTTPRGTVRVALHVKTRKLARHGGIRTRCSVIAMSGPACSRQGNPYRGGSRMAGTPERTQQQSQLAVHKRAGADQTQAPLPVTLGDSGH